MNPQRYKKKPVEIEAVQYTGSYVSQLEIIDWAHPHISVWCDEIGVYLLVKTLEGDMKARRTDYIIRGIAGEYYPCNEKIFRASYEPVENPHTKILGSNNVSD